MFRSSGASHRQGVSAASALPWADAEYHFPFFRADGTFIEAKRAYKGAAGDLIAAFLKESRISAEEKERLRSLLDDMEV